MVQEGSQGKRSRVRAKAWAAELDGARRRAGLLLPGEIAAALGRLRQILGQWALAEIAPGRLFPWLAGAFGAGIVFYFTADREPLWWAALALAVLGLAVAIAARHRAFGFPLALGFAAMTAGFAVPAIETARIAHPVLGYPASGVTIGGFVEVREERERSDRTVLRVQHIEGEHLWKVSHIGRRGRKKFHLSGFCPIFLPSSVPEVEYGVATFFLELGTGI